MPLLGLLTRYVSFWGRREDKVFHWSFLFGHTSVRPPLQCGRDPPLIIRVVGTDPKDRVSVRVYAAWVLHGFPLGVYTGDVFRLIGVLDVFTRVCAPKAPDSSYLDSRTWVFSSWRTHNENTPLGARTRFIFSSASVPVFTHARCHSVKCLLRSRTALWAVRHRVDGCSSLQALRSREFGMSAVQECVALLSISPVCLQIDGTTNFVHTLPFTCGKRTAGADAGGGLYGRTGVARQTQVVGRGPVLT